MYIYIYIYVIASCVCVNYNSAVLPCCFKPRSILKPPPLKQLHTYIQP